MPKIIISKKSRELASKAVKTKSALSKAASYLPNSESVEDKTIRFMSDFLREGATQVQFKASNNNNLYSRYKDNPKGFVDNVLKEYLTDEIIEVMESVRDNQITAVPSCNSAGKTYGAPRLMTWLYTCYEGCKIYVTMPPPEENLKRQIGLEFEGLIKAHGHLFTNEKLNFTSLSWVRSKTETDKFINGVTIPQTGGPEARASRFSGKHAKKLVFIIDEADAIPQEIFTAIEGCMSDANARLVLFYNPRSQVNPVETLIKNGRAHVVRISAFSHPNVTTGKIVIPGAVDRETTVRRIVEWTKPIIEGEKKDSPGIFKIPDFLIGYRAKDTSGSTLYEPLQAGYRRIEQPEFSYMVLGEVPSRNSNQLIDKAWLDRTHDNYAKYTQTYGTRPPYYPRPVAGYDPAEMGEDKSVLTFKYNDFVDKPVIWAGVDTGVSCQRIYENCILRGCNEIFIDSNGLGLGFKPVLKEKGMNCHRIMVQAVSDKSCEFGQFHLVRDEGFWALREWIRTNPNAIIPPDDELDEELLALDYFPDPRTGKIKVTPKDVLKEKLPGRRSPDKASSLMTMFCPIPKDSEGSEAYQFNYINDTSGNRMINVPKVGKVQ